MRIVVFLFLAPIVLGALVYIIELLRRRALPGTGDAHVREDPYVVAELERAEDHARHFGSTGF